MARARLRELAQGKRSITEYVAAFNALIARVPEMHVKDKIFAFIEGLNREVKAHVDEVAHVTLDTAIERAVRFGTRHARHEAKAAQSSHAPMDLDAIEGLEGETDGGGEGEGAGARASAADTPVTRAELRELLNAMREERKGPPARGGRGGGRSDPNSHRMRGLPHIPHLSPVQVQEYMDAGKCFGCGSKEHQSRQCPKRKEDGKGRVSWSN